MSPLALQAVEHMAQPGFVASQAENANKYAFFKPHDSDPSLSKIPPEGLHLPVVLEWEKLPIDAMGTLVTHAHQTTITITPLKTGSPAQRASVLGKRHAETGGVRVVWLDKGVLVGVLSLRCHKARLGHVLHRLQGKGRHGSLS